MAPQVSILGIGKIQTLPRYISLKQENGKTTQELLPRKIVCFYYFQVSVTYGGDHRVVNGATAARFLKKWKDYLENPSSILLNLK
jgi:2-oxoisovalerate dehydrogenase E2 component (dihydrolipoyl transacylase)